MLSSVSTSEKKNTARPGTRPREIKSLWQYRLKTYNEHCTLLTLALITLNTYVASQNLYFASQTWHEGLHFGYPTCKQGRDSAKHVLL